MIRVRELRLNTEKDPNLLKIQTRIQIRPKYPETDPDPQLRIEFICIHLTIDLNDAVLMKNIGVVVPDPGQLVIMGLWIRIKRI